MRQRKLKNLDHKYEAYADILIDDPSDMRDHWQDRAGGRPIYTEIGCGKGKFISEIAERERDSFFIAVESNKSVMLRAMEKIREKRLSNVVFIPDFAGDLSEWFSPGEVSGIYLNFSDPLPKNYWYKRRLTYRYRLKSYFEVLEPDGTVTFKTDNTDLFNWSVLEIMAADLRILDITRDLHADPEAKACNIETEYEAKYSRLGEKIKRVVIGRRKAVERAVPGEAAGPSALEDKEESEMTAKGMAAINGRDIPKEDKVFAAVARAGEAEKARGKAAVFNATAGALTDDEGALVVLKSVSGTIRSLSDTDFAQYAPIAGTPEFKEAIKRAAFGSYEPKSYVRVVASPGGTGAIRNAVDNYSCPGDKVLTHNWCWANYRTIASELGRSLETFEMFDQDGVFNIEDFEYKVKKLIRNQEHLVIILNTPANNPTGYALTMDDWYGVKRVLDEVPLDKKVALVLDVAYIDYAGESDEVRGFLPVVDSFRSNVLPIVAYSASKTFTMYGFRCAAMICMAYSPEVADEFESVCCFSSRTAWSNSPRPAMTAIAKIYADEELLAETDAERAFWRDKLLARGRAFEEAAREAGLGIVPFTAGFFVTVPCDDSDALCRALEKKDVFLIAIKGGARVSIASLSEDKCRRLPKIIKETMEEISE